MGLTYCAILKGRNLHDCFAVLSFEWFHLFCGCLLDSMIGILFPLLGNNLRVLKNRFWTSLVFTIFAVSFLNPLLSRSCSSSFLFQTFRSICSSISRMTKANVHVLKKSETNSWIFMKIWWHIVVRSSWCTALLICTNTGTKVSTYVIGSPICMMPLRRSPKNTYYGEIVHWSCGAWSAGVERSERQSAQKMIQILPLFPLNLSGRARERRMRNCNQMLLAEDEC